MKFSPLPLRGGQETNLLRHISRTRVYQSQNVQLDNEVYGIFKHTVDERVMDKDRIG